MCKVIVALLQAAEYCCRLRVAKFAQLTQEPCRPQLALKLDLILFLDLLVEAVFKRRHNALADVFKGLAHIRRDTRIEGNQLELFGRHIQKLSVVKHRIARESAVWRKH